MDDRLALRVVMDLFHALDDRVLDGFWRTLKRRRAVNAQFGVARTTTSTGEESYAQGAPSEWAGAPARA